MRIVIFALFALVPLVSALDCRFAATFLRKPNDRQMSKLTLSVTEKQFPFDYKTSFFLFLRLLTLSHLTLFAPARTPHSSQPISEVYISVAYSFYRPLATFCEKQKHIKKADSVRMLNALENRGAALLLSE